MLKILYNIYIYDKVHNIILSDNYINIHQVWLDMSLNKQQVEQTIAQYVIELYGHDHQYQYKYAMQHL